MNNVYLRSKDSIKNIINRYFFALLPLIIYGFYKNGIKLYLNHLVGIKGLLKPLVFDVSGLLIGVIVNIIYIKLIKKEDVKGSVFSSFNPLYGLLIASVISINTNIFIFIFITFICLLGINFLKNLKINVISFTSLIIILITNLLGHFTYMNAYEQANTLTLSSLDYLIGRGSGGINTTCVLLLIFSIIILSKMESYKKDIVVYLISLFVIFIISYSAMNNELGLIFNRLFSNGILFSFIFVAPESKTSSYTSKGKIIYCLLIIISFIILYLIYPPLSALGGITIASILSNFIDKLCQR